jgi:sugar PTS system EIIA component
MRLFNRKDKQKIIAQQSGKAVPITEVPDPVFSEKILGDGVGIIPSNGEVFAPVSGKIAQVANTRHAIGIESDDGLEVLIHLGIDTVKLEGQGFTCYVEVGQHVSAGDKLMDMDLDFIKSKGLNTISPCIITNMDAVKNLEMLIGEVTAGESTVMTYKK